MCEHQPEKISCFTHPGVWGDIEEVYVCECGESWDHDPSEDVDEADVDIEEIKTF